MTKTKEELIHVLEENMKDIMGRKNTVRDIKSHLGRKNGIEGGVLVSIFNNPEILNEMDQREVALITEQFYQKTGNEELNPSNWFTVQEMNTARQYDRRVEKGLDMDEEVVFENVNIVAENVYSTIISPKTISSLLSNQILYYDYNIQRTPEMGKDGIVKRARVYKKNVKEITKNLLNGQQKPTTIVFNVPVGSLEEGEELVYNPENRTLTLTEGARMAVLDGYHRCLGSQEAYTINPDLNFNYILEITHYSTREAQQWQAQHAKATPIPKARIQMFENSRHADTVAKSLMADSELKNRVAVQGVLSLSAGHLVSYSVLTDAIEREFPMEFRRDTLEVAKYLTEFFDELIAEYADVMLDEKSKSLIRYNKMFAGHIALAAKMKEDGVEVTELKNILDEIDFSRDNPLWKEIGVTTDDNKIVARVDEVKLAKYFRSLIK